MSYRAKRAAFQIAFMFIIIMALRMTFEGMIASNWLAGLSLAVAMLANSFFARPLSHRKWPEPKKGWTE